MRRRLRYWWRVRIIEAAIHVEQENGGTVEEIVYRAVSRVPRSWVSFIDRDGGVHLS